MAAPGYVPPSQADRPRDSLPIPPPRRWTATRPADLLGGQPRGRTLGSPGPDQGYALALARRLQERLQLTEGEHRQDVVAGMVPIALRRASLFGRAPVIHDLELAANLFGFLDDPASVPTDLLAWRRRAFAGASHSYWDQRAIVDAVPEPTLRMAHGALRGRLAEWQTLAGATG